MKKLILNADDFGRHPLINKAVKLAAESGMLRSATVMTTEEYFPEAVDIAKENPRLGVGVHLTLVNSTPLLPAREIPTLVGTDGRFLPDHKALVKRLISGGVNLGEVRRELSAQLEKFARTGLTPTHVDSHQHMHTLPGIIDVVLDLAKNAGIKAVRIPAAPINTPDGLFFGGLGAFIGRSGLKTLAEVARLKAKRRGLKYPRHFAGLVAGDAVTPEYLAEIAANMPSGSLEVMLHPGTDNNALVAATEWQHDFEAEYRAISDEKIMARLGERKIILSNFKDL